MSDDFSFKKGDRIELIEMPQDPCPVSPGTKGTIREVVFHLWSNGMTQYEIDWDDGRSLSLIVPPDKAKKI